MVRMDRGTLNNLEFLDLLLTILCWVFVAVSTGVLILTTLTTYHFLYLQYFNNYDALQLSMFISQLLWGIRFMIDSKRWPKSKVYGMISLAMAAVSLFFFYSGVS
ncbi:hypothetical protein J2Z34_002678 [Youngiibacter multivorans]|uniref:Uncharacterized protein n=2 Tax=Youngiibacter multivorans TaxID=937251 RepID=A0ABS4G7D9_9CLOT|nr:hypothetical protein [Youngiibacter multivorans]